ncbi:hypothetical protein [Mycobacteroides abscessus]|uniref:hypothetical protein n=1 Tax=Mycobacteroides abscessus TaxID=36809 RepID=UPI00092946CD|nr:hypothetical protein [Mycobacteroides abscessus]SHO82649.1 Uncharacterised protein [Mycobacteroides abscessus subsp. abscessus]SHP25624.1 Uncharacterised protein [Mycobacteroides abscessus subsp. abscessus]SHP72140.1 Uncharacterised protein [Mycobacteroides abscessus subsp. abscessus]SHQ92239.1 Uncharacterised protein [Mycobacteroides abscessus subsp. abscessus]SHR00043.1 Uncharacterised protein [Mycobacteroides abscessus subsp. abscessus]
MKKNLILAASTLAVVGLTACGNDTPVAQPIPADKDCTELAKPNDPHNLIGNEWPWAACDALSDVQPGVDQARAEAIVLDARQRVAAAKRNISTLATVGNRETDPVALTQFHDRIEDVRGRLADDLMASSLALKGTPPQGFRLAYSKTYDPSKTCSDAWDFDKCIATDGKDKGTFPYETHTASPGVTEGQGR